MVHPDTHNFHQFVSRHWKEFLLNSRSMVLQWRFSLAHQLLFLEERKFCIPVSGLSGELLDVMHLRMSIVNIQRLS